MKRGTVSFRAGTVINALWVEGPDRVPVREGQDCAMLAGIFTGVLRRLRAKNSEGPTSSSPRRTQQHALPVRGACGRCHRCDHRLICRTSRRGFSVTAATRPDDWRAETAWCNQSYVISPWYRAVSYNLPDLWESLVECEYRYKAQNGSGG